MPKSKMDKNIVTSALDGDAFVYYLKNVSDEELSLNIDKIITFWKFWSGKPDKKWLLNLRKSFLEEFLNFNEINNRYNKIDDFEKNKYGSIKLFDFIPELEYIANKMEEKLHKLPNDMRKAELWLLRSAKSAWPSSEMEAVIYFASRGKMDVLNINEIEKSWHRLIFDDVLKLNIHSDLRKKARSHSLTVREAGDLLQYYTPFNWMRFFAFRDEEEDFIDATFYRSIEFLGFKDYEVWLQSFAKDFSEVVRSGVEPDSFYSNAFFWCRSNLALQYTERPALESLLWAMMNNGYGFNLPWKKYRNRKDNKIIDFLPIAGVLPFIWCRIKHDEKNEMVENALSLLRNTQLNNGGWPLYSDESEADIMSTCYAIHGLCISKPNGWESICKKASYWLKTQQTNDGCWYIEGGPTVMITVLVLDSISLAEGSNITSINTPLKLAQKTPAMEDQSYSYDFENEPYTKYTFPESISKKYEDMKNNIKPSVGIIVATDVELKQLLNVLKPLTRHNKIVKIHWKANTYYLGLMGKQIAVVVLTNMGSEGPNASTLTIDKLISDWSIKFVILAGIAFGMDKKIHLPGDVLISESIIPYEKQRISEGEINYRNSIPPASPVLLNRIRNIKNTWIFTRPDQSKCKVHIGPILSGEKLIDNAETKQKLSDKYPNAIGGEMEGSGLWSACSHQNINWIIIKAVCDWADGQKNKIFQPMAAASAMSLCERLLEDEHIFDGL